ncbi:MAG TPA: RidA family protein [Euzebyales bacterium]|nr:RidA family protein [Euzebyales bacterium]
MARRVPRTADVAPPQAHYSHAVVAGNVVYVAGQVPVDEHGTVIDGDAEAQARQVMENLTRVVEAAGASMDDVVKTTVFLTNLGDREAVGRVRREYFSDPPPANTLLVVSSLANPAFRVEIEAVAHVGEAPS